MLQNENQRKNNLIKLVHRIQNILAYVSGFFLLRRMKHDKENVRTLSVRQK